MDKERFGGLTAFDTRREAYGGSAARPDPLTRADQSEARGFDGTTLAKAAGNWTSCPPPWHAARPAAARTRVQAEIEEITRKPSVRRVITWQLTGGQPADRPDLEHQPARPCRAGRRDLRKTR